MTADKIDRTQLGDPRALARFQQAHPSAASDARAARSEMKIGDVPHSAPEGEKLEISASARDLARLRDLLQAGRDRLAQEPPDRSAKLETVRRRLQSGVYGSAEIRHQVAGKLVGLLSELDSLLE